MKLETKVLREKLDRLKKTDKNFRVFGSRKHLYKSFPVPEKEIEILEKDFNFEVPTNFRQFLIEIGHGAGPYYGVYSLKEIRAELSEIKALEAEENVKVSPAVAFPFDQNSIKEINTKVLTGTKDVWKKTTFPSNGSIPILTHGCTFYSALITSGELTGQIWDIACDEGFNALWIPTSAPTILTISRKSFAGKEEIKRLPENDDQNILCQCYKFEEWFEKWLDDSLLALHQFNELNSSIVFGKWKSLT